MKNLLAMFEQKPADSTSSSPKPPGRETTPKPLGRVKSDFVAVAKDGRFAGLQRADSGGPLSPSTAGPSNPFGTPTPAEEKRPAFGTPSSSTASVPLVAPTPIKPLQQPIAKLEPAAKKEEPKAEEKPKEEPKKVELKKVEPKKEEPKPEVKKEEPKPEVKKVEPKVEVKKEEPKKVEPKQESLPVPKPPSCKASPAPITRQKTPQPKVEEKPKVEEPKKDVKKEEKHVKIAPTKKEASRSKREVQTSSNRAQQKEPEKKTEAKTEPKPILKAAPKPTVPTVQEPKPGKIAERKPERKIAAEKPEAKAPAKEETKKPEPPKLRVPPNRMPVKAENKGLAPPKSPMAPRSPRSPLPRSATRSPAPPKSALPRTATRSPTKAASPKLTIKAEPRKAVPPPLKSPLKNSMSASSSTLSPSPTPRRHTNFPHENKPMKKVAPKTATVPLSPRLPAAIKIPRPSSVMSAPKGKSPTEVELIPRASIYAPTASWIAKHMPDPLVRSPTAAEIRRPITPSVKRYNGTSQISPTRRPATAASHRPSSTAQNRRSMGTTLPAPDMTFLEKLMRPTQSIASKFEGKRELVERSRSANKSASSRAGSGSRGSSRTRKLSGSTEDIPPVPSISAAADTAAWAAGRKRTNPEPLSFNQVSLAQALEGEVTPKLQGPPESAATTEEQMSVDENHSEVAHEDEDVQSVDHSAVHEKEGEILSDSEIQNETPAPAAIVA